MRGLFNALRYMIPGGLSLAHDPPTDLPPWSTVHQQAQRWIKAGCFEARAHDRREVLRVAAEKPAQPSAVILDGLSPEASFVEWVGEDSTFGRLKAEGAIPRKGVPQDSSQHLGEAPA